MAVILDSHDSYNKLEREVKKLIGGRKLCLASVAVGENYSTGVYRFSQKKAALKLGVRYRSIDFPLNVSFRKFKEEVNKLNREKTITGIILNKPFPSAWKDVAVFSLLDEKKDIEGMHPVNIGKFFMGEPRFISPTVLSVLELLSPCIGKNYSGKKVTLVGFSSLIGKPLALFLADNFATVSVTHIATYQAGFLPAYVNGADILISAVGKPHIIKGEWIKEGAVVIDVGTGEKDSVLTGDVEFDVAKEKASFITPMTGGIGKLTVMFLYYNLAKAGKI